MSDVKIAVVGLGHAANDFHLPVLSEFEDVEVSLCDTWEQRLEEGRVKWHLPAERCFDNLDKLMDEVDPDGVYVTIPQYTWRGREETPYLEVVKAVLACGKPVFVEKPLAMNYADAKMLVEAAEKAGVVTTQVGFQRRFNPLLREGLARIRQRGPLLNCSFGFAKGEGPYDPETNVLPIPPYDHLTLDFIHCLDLMRWAPQGELVDFFSTVGRVEGEAELTQFHAMGKFDNGCTSIFTSNMRVGARVLDWQLHGINISVYITMYYQGYHESAMVATIFADDNFEKPEVIHDYEYAANANIQACVGFWGEDRHFVECVQQGVGTECSFADAAKSSELAERVLQGK